VRGRFEQMTAPKGWTAIVDYAHTPDALEKCLQSIRHLLPPTGAGKVITVFGAGGDRDRTKRPLMGRIAAMLSDAVIVTSDNPRTEDPEAIIREIVEGIGDRSKLMTIVDRAEAIRTAVSNARPGDVVLVAGKGHEDYQVIGKEKIHFSDREVIEACF
jgi:UDP-N-acetylmuramoyl-L-alanyl-D-glutamate--2,6-diaminopimelate ligase